MSDLSNSKGGYVTRLCSKSQCLVARASCPCALFLLVLVVVLVLEDGGSLTAEGAETRRGDFSQPLVHPCPVFLCVPLRPLRFNSSPLSSFPRSRRADGTYFLKQAVGAQKRDPVFLGNERLIEHRWGYVTGVLFEKSVAVGQAFQPDMVALVRLESLTYTLRACGNAALAWKKSKQRPPATCRARRR